MSAQRLIVCTCVVSRSNLVDKFITYIGELLVLLRLHVYLPLQPSSLHLRFTQASTKLSYLGILNNTQLINHLFSSSLNQSINQSDNLSVNHTRSEIIEMSVTRYKKDE